MAEVFDAESAGIEAIATSPDITPGVDLAGDGGEESAKPEGKALSGPVEWGTEYQPDKRNGRLLALALKQWDKNKRLEKEQIDAAEEIGSEAFGAINAAPVPRLLKLLLVGVLLLASVVPLGVEIKVSLQEGEKDNGND